MQTSNQVHFSIRLFYLVLLIITGISVWFSQNSINAYWQQTYHQDSPLMRLNRFAWWAAGSELQQIATDFYQMQKVKLEDIDVFHGNKNMLEISSQLETPEVEKVEIKHVELEQARTDTPLSHDSILNGNERAAHTAETAIVKLKQPIINEVTPVSVAGQIISSSEVPKTAVSIGEKKVNDNASNGEIKENLVENNSQQVMLTVKDKVLFAGDSLMQGVAPHIQKWLKNDYKIQSINLSKQSTGLSYPSFFDWPKTIENTLKQHPDIRLVIIFLGPNDPWDFPDPDKKYKYLKFQSPEWEAIYKQRIERILASAQKYKAEIIWLGIPHMKKTALNKQMAYLNQVISETIISQAILLPTEKLLSEGTDNYLDSIIYNGKKTRVRSKDGIHFSLDGQRIIADYVQQHISIQ